MARSPSRRDERALARRRQFITVARAVFNEKGFTKTRIDDIMARIGGSRGTLYVHFRSKLALFEEVVREEAARFSQAVADVITSVGDPDIDLDNATEQLLALAASEDIIGLLRTVIAERHNHPAIGDIYRENATKVRLWIGWLFREKLEAFPDQGDDAREILADMFLSVIFADTQMAILTGFAQEDQREAYFARTRQRLRCLFALRDYLEILRPTETVPPSPEENPDDD